MIAAWQVLRPVFFILLLNCAFKYLSFFASCPSSIHVSQKNPLTSRLSCLFIPISASIFLRRVSLVCRVDTPVALHKAHTFDWNTNKFILKYSFRKKCFQYYIPWWLTAFISVDKISNCQNIRNLSTFKNRNGNGNIHE